MNRGPRFLSKNPFTLEVMKEFPFATAAEYNSILDKSQAAYKIHKKLSYSQRAEKLVKLASIIESRKDECARMITQEMGKPVSVAGGEATRIAQFCRYYAENGEKYLSDSSVETEAKKSYVHYEPIGPIFAVQPWNFPLWLPAKSGIPAIMAGNTYILKPAPNVTQTAFLLQELFEEAGFDNGEFQTALFDNELSGNAIADSRVAGVTFTGSGPTGSIIASKAGAALKKVVLELGGSDPFIVLKDAPIEEVAKKAVMGRVANSGQVCISPKRMIIDKSVIKEFEEAAIKHMDAIKFGNPLEGDVNFGPMAREDIFDKIKQQVADAQSEGAKIVFQKEHENASGLYFPPTIMSNIGADSLLAKEEVFGPVLVLMPADNEEHAVEIANNTNFGLS